MEEYKVSEFATFIFSLLVLVAGNFLCTRIAFLKRAAIPSAVVGGILAAILVTVTESATGVRIEFAGKLRDILILLFFVSLGLTARLSTLRSGGKPLLLLCGVTVLLLILQNLVGIGVAMIQGVHPFYGLLAGSISFVGGPGTAMAWAKEASSQGLQHAELVAISFATLAVTTGAILAGPVVTHIIRRHKLREQLPQETEQHVWEAGKAIVPPSDIKMVIVMLLMSAAIWIGMRLNHWSTGLNLLLPGFLCSLLAGMLIANLSDWRKIPLPVNLSNRIGDLSLQVFLAISMMSLDLSSIGVILVPLVIVIVLQVTLTVCVAYFILFRYMGKNYDAAVTVGGFIGFAVSSMPVAMATMDQVEKRFGPAPNAVLLITLAGSFFVDLANTFIVKTFVAFLPAIGR